MRAMLVAWLCVLVVGCASAPSLLGPTPKPTLRAIDVYMNETSDYFESMASSTALGPGFASGMMVAMNSAPRNFLVFSWEDVANTGARAGDALMFTKRLGTGVISTALKQGTARDEDVRGSVESMLTLNRAACECMLAFDVHGCTDVSGFGLIGHTREMAAASGVTIEIETDRVRFLPGAVDYAAQELEVWRLRPRPGERPAIEGGPDRIIKRDGGGLEPRAIERNQADTPQLGFRVRCQQLFQAVLRPRSK